MEIYTEPDLIKHSALGFAQMNIKAWRAVTKVLEEHNCHIAISERSTGAHAIISTNYPKPKGDNNATTP